MIRQCRRGAGFAVGLALLLAACSGGDEQGLQPIEAPEPDGDDVADDGAGESDVPAPDPEPDEPVEPDEPADPPADDPAADEWAVPDEIDEAYAERVVNELYARTFEQLREARTSTQTGDLISNEVIASFRSFYAPSRVPDILAGFQTQADEGFPPERPDAGPWSFEASGVDFVDLDRCLLVAGEMDGTRVLAEDSPQFVFPTAVVTLTRAGGDVDSELNPTGWVVYQTWLDDTISEDVAREACQ